MHNSKSASHTVKGSANICVLMFLISWALDLSEGKMCLSLNITVSYVTLNQSFYLVCFLV